MARPLTENELRAEEVRVLSDSELLVGFELAVDVIEIRQCFGGCLERDQRRKQFLLQPLFG